MARDLTSGLLAELQASKLSPILFWEGEFVTIGSPQITEYVRLWTGFGNISWDSKTWIGAGNLLAITPLEETSEIQATGFSVTLSGMPSANISTALQACQQGRPGKIWLGTMNTAGAVIADPYLARQGRMDVPVIEDSGETCTITLKYEDRLVNLERPRERRYTNEDQAIDYPADKGFDQVAALQDAQDVWGS